MQSSLGRHWLRVLISLAISLSSIAIQAETLPSPLNGTVSNLDLRPNLEYWVENCANCPVSVEDLTAPEQPPYANFLKRNGNNYSFGYTKTAHWFRWRLAVTPDAEGEWWLQVAPTFLDSVDLYIPQGDGSYRKIHMGDHVPQPARPISARHFLAPLDLSSGTTGYYYLRVQTTSTLTLGLTLWSPEAYSYSLGIENSLYGLLFGLVLATVVVTLISGLWIRKPFYFITAGFVFFNGFMHFILNGYDQLLYEQPGDWSDRLMSFTNFIAATFGVAMCLVFLKPEPHFPRLSKLMWALAGLSGVFALLALLGAPIPLAAAFGSTLLLILMSILITLMLRHRFVPALLMLILFVPGFLTLLFQIARNFSLLPLTFWTTHVWAIMTIFQTPYIALVVMLHLRAQEKAFLSEQQKARLHRDLFSMVAHELRTPLAVVGSAMANIELQTQDSHPELAPRFSRANLGLARLNTLIDNALAEDRLLDKGIQLQREWITPAALIEQVHELRPVEPPHYLHISLNNEDAQFFIDPHWVGLVVLNLLDNAIKYSPGGGQVYIHIGQENQMLKIEVADEGMGIPPEAADKIFDKFFRAENALALRGHSGMGLGLFLVQTVVTLHGGKLAYQPNPAGGSIFTVYLLRTTQE
ncbi:sensor histidine kinase [Cellvibrio sp. ARAG 10.3]|uniref:sensor histidine kinase n=1 Tax=Cellvibrio sp. ARAG 10.3 TaxID=3451358 RepID=UPI003F469805